MCIWKCYCVLVYLNKHKKQKLMFLNAHELIRKVHIELKISKLSRIYFCEFCWPYIYFRQKLWSFFFKIVDFRKCILLIKHFFNINLVLWFWGQVLKISSSKITVLKISVVKIYALKIPIYTKITFEKAKSKNFLRFIIPLTSIIHFWWSYILDTQNISRLITLFA